MTPVEAVMSQATDGSVQPIPGKEDAALLWSVWSLEFAAAGFQVVSSELEDPGA